MAPRTIQSLPLPKAAIGFRPEYLDFRRGIRVGNLEDHERITRMLKLELEARYGEAFVTERYGRGVYWQWIGYLPRANRLAKRKGCHIHAGTWGEPAPVSKTNWPGVQRLRKVLAAVARNEWAALQLYYPMSEDEVRGSSGVDLIEAMLAIFREVTPTMNRCMQVQIHERRAVS